MKHPTPEDLVLHCYGEARRPDRIDAHLSVCEECRRESSRLAQTLALCDAEPVPERPDDYETELWGRVRSRLAAGTTAPRPRLLSALRPLLLGGALAALLAAAFLAGRLWPPPPAPLPGAARERILLVAVGDHLDRSQMVLLEFLRSPSPDGRERGWAEDLASASRLYRQTAVREGDSGVAAALDALERVLLEIAHAPDAASREALRRRLESEGTLFKVRVIRSQIRQRETAGQAAAARS